MRLNIEDEFSPLKTVAVAWGNSIPQYKDYKTDDPEFTKFHPYSWDKELLFKQQEIFFEKLTNYGVEITFLETAAPLIWQMYTRDTGFVVGGRMYYAHNRKFGSRNGEIEKLLAALPFNSDQLQTVDGTIEGGDVLVVGKDQVYVGHSSRTNQEAITSLSKHITTKVFALGNQVMHLDTRLTVLPKKVALIVPSAFTDDDLEFLTTEFSVIEVTDEEAKRLGANVFVVNPETIFVPTEHRRLGDELKQKGFHIELIEYSEPINLGGSFRCTTLPLLRQD